MRRVLRSLGAILVPVLTVCALEAHADKAYMASGRTSRYVPGSLQWEDLPDGGLRGWGYFELRAPDGGGLVPGAQPVLVRVDREASTVTLLRAAMRDAGCSLAGCP